MFTAAVAQDLRSPPVAAKGWLTSPKSPLNCSKFQKLSSVCVSCRCLAASENGIVTVEIRPMPLYLSTDNRMKEINIHPGDNPQSIQHPIYDIMPLYNTIPLAVLGRVQQQGGVRCHADDQ